MEEPWWKWGRFLGCSSDPAVINLEPWLDGRGGLPGFGRLHIYLLTANALWCVCVCCSHLGIFFSLSVTWPMTRALGHLFLKSSWSIFLYLASALFCPPSYKDNASCTIRYALACTPVRQWPTKCRYYALQHILLPCGSCPPAFWSTHQQLMSTPLINSNCCYALSDQVTHDHWSAQIRSINQIKITDHEPFLCPSIIFQTIKTTKKPMNKKQTNKSPNHTSSSSAP